jgi:hypothetical protein
VLLKVGGTRWLPGFTLVFQMLGTLVKSLWGSWGFLLYYEVVFSSGT